MSHAPTRSLRATTAICAVLALGSTAAWAQDAAPPLDTPAVSAPVSPSAAPQPTIQLPSEAPAPQAPTASSSVVSQPVIEQPAQAATSAEAAPAKAAPVRTSAPRQAARAVAAPAAPVTRTAPASQVETAPAPQAAEPIPPAASVPLAQPAVAPPPAPVATTDTSNGPSPVVWIAGILVVLGAGTAGVSALRSRRRRMAVAYDDAAWSEPVHTATEPAPTVVASEPVAPLPAFTAIEEPASEPFRAAEDVPVAVEERHEAFVMPAGPVPQTRAQRDALLEEMVAAAPDSENPFTSRKGRLRRARIILQSLEHEQKEQATKPFDWRTYEPSTSHPAPATPARVTV